MLGQCTGAIAIGLWRLLSNSQGGRSVEKGVTVSYLQGLAGTEEDWR